MYFLQLQMERKEKRGEKERREREDRREKERMSVVVDVNFGDLRQVDERKVSFQSSFVSLLLIKETFFLLPTSLPSLACIPP